MPEYKIIVNKSTYTVEAEADTPLLWVLRDELELTGTKYSCGIGECGACTVLVDGRVTRSCLTPIDKVGNQAVTTIEGLASEVLHPLQAAWLDENVSQCGYCQPGQLMSAAALLAENPNPNDEDIDRVMSGVLCRCGTYPRIRRAIQKAAEVKE